METINFKSVSQDFVFVIQSGGTERLIVQSQKTKYVNGNMSGGVIEVGYSASINTSDYLMEEDKSINEILITARTDGISGRCIITQDETGDIKNIRLSTPKEREHWEIRFKPIAFNGKDQSDCFHVSTSISGESGSMGAMVGSAQYKNLKVNLDRHTINIYISVLYPPESSDMLSWSCRDEDGNAFSPTYSIPDNQYFTIETTDLVSTLKKVSTPSVSMGTLILPVKFNPTKKYPLALNFYWGTPKT